MNEIKGTSFFRHSLKNINSTIIGMSATNNVGGLTVWWIFSLKAQDNFPNVEVIQMFYRSTSGAIVPN
ncbi:MAG: hypothetical protein ACXWC7_14375 [Chitinophagaceae bacterium]